MRRERYLVGAGVVLLLAATLAPVLVPGALAEVPDDPRRPGPVHVSEMAISPGEIQGATADLQLRTRIEHARNPTPNVTVRYRAYDAESGLLVAEQTKKLGTVKRSQAVNGSLTVDREGGYVLETTLFRDGDVVDRTRRQVSGMEALTPPYADSQTRFADSAGVQPLSVAVESVGDNRTTLSIRAALTNGGDEPTGDLRVAFVLRGADSNLVADETSVTVDEIRPGRTEEVSATVDVSTNFNYYVDAVLYRDGVIVDSAVSVANLDPQETISPNRTTRDIEFDVSDFAGQDEGETPAPEATQEDAITETGGPGFGAVLAVVGVALAALLAVRGRNDTGGER